MSAPFDASYPGRPVGRCLPNPKLRFLDQCREVLRFKQMSHRTEEAYVDLHACDAEAGLGGEESAGWVRAGTVER